MEQCEDRPSFIPICVMYSTSPVDIDIKHCYVAMTWNQSSPLQVDETILIGCGFLYDYLLTKARGIHVFPFTEELPCQQLQHLTQLELILYLRDYYYTPPRDLPVGVISSDSELIPTCSIFEDMNQTFYYNSEFCLMADEEWLPHMRSHPWYASYSAHRTIGCSMQGADEGGLFLSMSFQYVSETGCKALNLLIVCMVTGDITNSTVRPCAHLYLSSSWSDSPDDEILIQYCREHHAVSQVMISSSHFSSYNLHELHDRCHTVGE